MKHLVLFTFLLISYFVSFGQTKLVIDRKNGTKDSIAVNTISNIKFSSSDIYQPSLLEVVTILDSSESKFIQYAHLTNGDLTNSMDLTEYWLLTQPNVESTFSNGDNYIYITLKSGIETTFYFDAIDDNGHSLYRGGKGGSTIHAGTEFINHANEILSHDIENKKVLLFETAVQGLHLEPQIQIVSAILNNAGLDLEVTILRDEQCTLESVETFKDYGLVIIDGHGQVSGFGLGKSFDFSNTPRTEESVRNQIDTQIGSGSADKVLSGDIELGASVKGNPKQSDWVNELKKDHVSSVSLSGYYLSKLPPMPKTIIFGNMCNSGFILTSFTTPSKQVITPDHMVVTIPGRTRTFEYPVGKAFIDLGLISYYGYTRNEFLFKTELIPIGSSRQVLDSMAKEMEIIFIKRLAEDQDSTGIANLKPDNITEYFEPENLNKMKYGNLYFRHYGANDYRYAKCGDTLTDIRDGQRYPTVCIGEQYWMKRNLNYNAPGSVTYENDPANGAIYGRLYNFNTIMQGAGSTSANPSGVRGICPNGWHVPSEEEFSDLSGTLGEQDGGKLKSTSFLWNSPNLNATNSSGFTALPGGFTSDISKPDYFLNKGYSAIFGTTTITESEWRCRGILADSDTLDGFSFDPQKHGVSCRCVKD
ncbi:MAG: FISUMP domain-containing protein [Saprospiraceae bacterium]